MEIPIVAPIMVIPITVEIPHMAVDSTEITSNVHSHTINTKIITMIPVNSPMAMDEVTIIHAEIVEMEMDILEEIPIIRIPEGLIKLEVVEMEIEEDRILPEVTQMGVLIPEVSSMAMVIPDEEDVMQQTKIQTRCVIAVMVLDILPGSVPLEDLAHHQPMLILFLVNHPMLFNLQHRSCLTFLNLQLNLRPCSVIMKMSLADNILAQAKIIFNNLTHRHL